MSPVRARRDLRLLDAAAGVALCGAILAAAAGSAIQRDLFHAGRPGRWLLLAAFVVVAFARAWSTRSTWCIRPRVAVLLAAACALSLASAGWTVSVHATIGHGLAQLAVLAGAAALAGCVADDPWLEDALVAGVLVAIGIVAAGSMVYWLSSSGEWSAVQPASTQYPARFRGLEFNPNTLAMLLAFGMPLALAGAVDTVRRAAVRLACLTLLFGCAAEIAASGSRGGLLAGFGGALAAAVLLPLGRSRRVLLALALAAGVVVCAWASTIPKALPPASASAAPAAATRGVDAEHVLPLAGEVGNPWWTHRSGDVHRRFFNTSVRARALVGSLHRWLQRPLLGFGYGAEIDAFVNRYYGFDSQNPENGYVGLLLQLGIVGLLVFVAAFVACVGAGALACLRRPEAQAAGIVGAAAGALLLGLSQSYFHGPGGIVFVTAWMSLLLASVLGLSRAPAQPAG